MLKLGEKEYTLKFGHTQLAALERATGKSVTQLAAQLGDPSKITVDFCISLLWSAFRKHHPEITMEEAGDILDDNGGIGVVMPQLLEGFTIAFPEEQEKSDRPTSAGAPRPSGNGTSFSPDGSKTASQQSTSGT